jgi:hypothetical protein
MTRHYYLLLLWLCINLGLLYPASARAAETLDQSQTVSQSPTTVYNDTQQAQIFTAGLYGTLDRVSLRLENWSASPPSGAVLNVSVQTVIAGVPSGKQIGSGTIPLNAIPPLGSPGWVDVTIHGAVVHAGTQYALVLQTSIWNADVTWWFAYTSYAGGEMAFNDGNTWSLSETNNFTFQTYVVPDAVDQSNPAGADQVFVTAMEGQTFTAGQSGVLDRVGVLLENFYARAPLQASIQTVTGGFPSGIVIGQGSIPASWSSGPWYPGWVDVDISDAVVTAGTQYALVLQGGSGQFTWSFAPSETYTGGDMVRNDGDGWRAENIPGYPTADAVFKTYVAPSFTYEPPPPPATITPCSLGVCPAVSGSVTPKDSTARVTSNVQFQELPNGTIHGILNFNDSKTGNFVLEGCTTTSAACRLTVTTFACTDQHAITVAGTYTPNGETTSNYLLTLSGVTDGMGTFTLTVASPIATFQGGGPHAVANLVGDYTYTLAHKGIVDVTCSPVAGVVY